MPTTSAADDRRPIPSLPPLNWRKELPKYRIGRDVYPSPNDRHRHELPFSSFSDGSVWQQADRPHKAGEVITTDQWPHPMFSPLNYSAKMVLEFFGAATKSRLPRSPIVDGRVMLSDGLTGPLPQITAPKPEPVRLQPRQAWPGL
jgi:hypothetical protein